MRYAHGIAYQTWIADLGEWQTNEQIEWDLREMKKIGVNSVRVDFGTLMLFVFCYLLIHQSD